MDVDQYEEQFGANLAQILSGIGKQQQLFNALMRDVKTELASLADVRAQHHELLESNQELRTLILEQGTELRAQGADLRRLREQLEGGTHE